MKHVIALAAIFAAGTLLSCNKNMDNAKTEETSSADMQIAENAQQTDQRNPIPVPVSTAQQMPVTDSAASPGITQTQIDWDKKIIKTGTVKFEVKKFETFNKDVRSKIRKYGAYIAQEDNNTEHDRQEVNLTIKVPVASFDGLMDEIGTADSKQIEKTIRTEDVTSEVVDTKSRLEAKKEMRLKYLEFLKQSKNMKEVLEVQAEINSIQEEIESAAGRIQYLNKNAAYSSIQLSFYEPFDNFSGDPKDDGFFTKTGEAFSRGAALVKGLLLVLISIWPLIALALVGFLYWKRKKQPVAAGVKQ